MININEYLINKSKKKKTVPTPTIGCDIQQIIDWLDSFGIYNWYSDHSSLVIPDAGEVGYKIMNGSWDNKCVVLDFCPHKHNLMHITIYSDKKCQNENEIATNYNKPTKITFDEALDYMKQVISDPTEPIKFKDSNKVH